MQQFSTSDGDSTRVESFDHDGVTVTPTPLSGEDHSAATTVFLTSDTYHADKHCPYLHQSKIHTHDASQIRHVAARTLEHVITTWNDLSPCSHCTLPPEKAAQVAIEHENVPESVIKIRS